MPMRVRKAVSEGYKVPIPVKKTFEDKKRYGEINVDIQDPNGMINPMKRTLDDAKILEE